MAASDVFDEYFKRADLDRDGKISGAEAVAFFQGSNLPKNVLAQVWMHADQSKSGFLGRQEFYNALKLVTVAQSGRQLTPEIVKSALYGPAAAKIPAPKINPVSSPMPPLNTATTPTIPTNSLRPSSNQFGSVGPNAPQNVGFRPTQAPQNTAIKQQFLPTENINLARPPQGTPTAAFPQMQGGNLGLTGGNTVAGPGLQSPINANPSSDWLGGMPSGTSVGGTSQAPVRGNTPQSKDGLLLSFSGTTGIPSRPQTQSALTSSVVPKTLDPNFASSKPSESKALGVSGYDFSSDSFYGGGGFPATSQANSGTNVLNFSANSMVNSSSIVPAPVGTQSANRSSQLDPTQIPRSFPPVNQLQQTQTSVKQNQFDNLKTSPSLTAPNGTAELANSVAAQTPVQWPKITQADIKKYTNVFVNVDKDRDGKITGDQARSLFLSWKLPREVLKQVWDLSDQDSDSMLSLREFCIALYLMERYREGRPLPSVLPSTVMYDETLMRATGMPSAAYATPNWQPGLPQGLPGPHPVMQATGIRVPMPNSIPRQAFSERHLAQQNLLKPGLSSQTAKNAGKDAPSTVNTDQEASNVDSKVQRAENKILDSKEKIEFYRTKMQELVLYKSRCDNRLNEITERASADKREVELLAKKYEEKYRQVGELASKLAIEEAKFRDIQERKMEMQNAIINIEQGGTADGLLQVRVDRIQSDLESLEKILNDRCKQLNAHVKATTSIELPFGWEPGPLEGAANWDEDWDKFEDEGFTVTKDHTSGNVNIVVNGDPPDSPSIWSDKASTEGASPIASSFNVDGKNEKLYDIHEHMNGSAYDEEESTRSPTASPGRSPLESPFNSTQFGVNEISSHTKESHSYHVDAESTVSGDKYNDEPWTFDDNDSVWKETDYESNPRDSFFTSDFGSIKADSPSASSVFGKEKKSSFFDDSVPSSPMFNTASSTIFSDGRDDYNFSSFGRFDSFATQDSAFPARESFSRFDSISSSRPETFTRFDSISSNKDFGQRRGFESFDDADPFGSTGPFKSSGGHSPRQGSDNWRAF